MIGLVRPSGDPREISKQCGFPARLTSVFEPAYASYASACPRFDDSFPKAGLPDADRTELMALYGKNRDLLREAAISAQPLDSYSRSRCQLCGLSELRDLDHYLGQSAFPEFAIHPFNVVPTCGKCNTSRKTFDDGGQRRILHLYFDDPWELPQMVQATIVGTAPGLVAKYAVQISTASSLELLFTRQWEVLRLRERYEALAPAKLKELTRTCSRQRSRVAVQKILHEQAADYEEDRGLNDWEVALCRAAAASNDFLQGCGVP